MDLELDLLLQVAERQPRTLPSVALLRLFDSIVMRRGRILDDDAWNAHSLRFCYALTNLSSLGFLMPGDNVRWRQVRAVQERLSDAGRGFSVGIFYTVEPDPVVSRLLSLPDVAIEDDYGVYDALLCISATELQMQQPSPAFQEAQARSRRRRPRRRPSAATST
jgi:hypothetical protein